MASIHELLRIFTALFLLIHASSSEKRTHFTIDQVANPNHVSFSPEYLHARTLAKYGYYSRSLIALSLVLMNSSVETNPVEDDRSWRTPVTVGTDTMLVSLDTGSSDL